MTKETASLALCESCHSAATETSADDACEVCELRAKAATQQARIEELETQLSEKIGGKASIEREGDARPHVMIIGDSQLVKMRRPPHSMADHLGTRTPRMLPRWQAGQGLDGMLSYLMTGLEGDKAEGRKFHVLWFGGLHDITLEEYERSNYLIKLQEALQKVKEQPRVLSVSWATLPESAQNAEVRYINEALVAWAAENDWLQVLDLRYISRRDGTMEISETMWNPKGSQLVCESLKKFLIKKLDYSDDELKALEASAKRNKEIRESKEKRKQNKRGGQTKTNGQPVGQQQQSQQQQQQSGAKSSAPATKKAAQNNAQSANKKYPPVQIKTKVGGTKNGPAQKQQKVGGKPQRGQQKSAVNAAAYNTGNKRAFPNSNAPAWAGSAIAQKRANGQQSKRARMDNGVYGQAAQGYGQTSQGYSQASQGYASGYSQSQPLSQGQSYSQNAYGGKYSNTSNGGNYAYGNTNDAYNSTYY